MLILILHYKNFNEKKLNGNEIRRTAMAYSKTKESSSRHTTETMVLDLATNKENDSADVEDTSYHTD